MAPDGTGYDNFAWLYYRHWTSYADEVWPVLAHLVLPSLPDRAHIIDLCCGTGNTASHLVAHGYQVTGIDNSAKMLEYAHQESPGAQFFLQDARTMAVDVPASAVLSLFDSLNHMLTAEDLLAVFSRVYRALEPGGLFLFDLNTLRKYESRWTGTDAIIEKDHVAALTSTFDLKSRMASFTAAIFLSESEHWVRYDVSLAQRAYRLSDVGQWLKQCGFNSVRIINGLTVSDNPRFAGRAFFLCVKPPAHS